MKKEKNCRHCGEKLDSNNYICLNCGKDQRGLLKRHPILTISMVVLVLICISVGIIFSKINSIENNDTEQKGELENILGDLWQDTSITADELIQEYEEDEKGADLDFDDNYIELTGKIKELEEVDKRTIKIELKVSEKSDYKIYCYFDKDDNEFYDELKDYKVDRKITTVGELTRSGKKLSMNYCILGDWETYYSFDNTFNIDLDLEDLLKKVKKDDNTIKLSEDNIMSFDSDILTYEGYYSYEDIINNISKISKDEVKISDISEKSGTSNRTITMKINKKEVSIKIKNDNSNFDQTLVYAINKVLKDDNSDKMFYYSFMDYEEDFGIVNIAYSTQDDINKINKMLKKSNLEIEQFKNQVESKSI